MSASLDSTDPARPVSREGPAVAGSSGRADRGADPPGRTTASTFGERVRRVRIGVVIGLAAVTIFLAVRDGADFWITRDQRGQRLADREEYVAAAEVFADPFRQADALFRGGDFEAAAAVWGGLPGPVAAYNSGNALVMLGKYEEAVGRYDVALVDRPDWQEAKTNREIAAQRAKRLETEGGDMTGGEMEPDEIVFDANKGSRDNESPTEPSEQVQLSDQEARATWLRQVQTTPGEFLKSKFAYQAAFAEDEERSDSDQDAANPAANREARR